MSKEHDIARVREELAADMDDNPILAESVRLHEWMESELGS